MRLDGTYGQLTADERKIYDLMVRIGQHHDRWESWSKALEFIRGYHAEHGTWPSQDQVRQAPGFYLDSRDYAVAVAAARDLPATGQAAPASTAASQHPPAPAESQDLAASAPAAAREMARRVAEAIGTAGRSPGAAGIQITETPGEPPLTYDIRLPGPVARALELDSGAYGHAEQLIALALGVRAVTVLRADSGPDETIATLSLRGAGPAPDPGAGPRRRRRGRPLCRRSTSRGAGRPGPDRGRQAARCRGPASRAGTRPGPGR